MITHHEPGPVVAQRARRTIGPDRRSIAGALGGLALGIALAALLAPPPEAQSAAPLGHRDAGKAALEAVAVAEPVSTARQPIATPRGGRSPNLLSAARAP
jgi:hypothetical protein